jgi:hypothetical protein
LRISLVVPSRFGIRVFWGGRLRLRVLGLGKGVGLLGVRLVSSLGLRVQGLGFRVSDIMLRIVG